MSHSINFKRLGYGFITPVCIVGALAGCEFCVPLLAAAATVPSIRHLTDGFRSHAVQPV